MLVPFVQRKPIDWAAIQRILSPSVEANHFTNHGPVKAALEERLHAMLGLSCERAVLCVANGTVALHLLMQWHERRAGRPLRWGIPAFTFASPVVGTGQIAEDIDPLTYTLREDRSFDGYVITSLFGTDCSMQDWANVAASEGKPLIFDNASSPLGTTRDGTPLCAVGDCIGSLHHTKYLGFGEGGFVVVDREHYPDLSAMTNFGFTPVARKHHPVSSNWKLSDPAAAFILSHIESYDLARHREIQGRLVRGLADVPGLQPFNHSSGIVYGNLPVLFEQPTEAATFRAIGIEANQYYRPLGEPDAYPHAWALHRRLVNFPLHAGLSDYQVDLMVRYIRAHVTPQARAA